MRGEPVIAGDILVNGSGGASQTLRLRTPNCHQLGTGADLRKEENREVVKERKEGGRDGGKEGRKEGRKVGNAGYLMTVAYDT